MRGSVIGQSEVMAKRRCYANVGGAPITRSGLRAAELYGPGGAIDTSQPFQVVSTFSADGTVMIDLEQGETVLRLLDGSPAGTPAHAQNVPRTAMCPHASELTAVPCGIGVPSVCALPQCLFSLPATSPRGRFTADGRSCGQ